MCRYAIAILAVPFCVLPATQRRATSDDNANAPTISVTKLDVGDEILELHYEIRNNSDNDTWILIGWDASGGYCEVFVAEDDHTLMIRRRLCLALPFGFNPPLFYGRHARLRPGESWTNVFLCEIPVRPRSDFERAERKERGLEHATRLAIEMGYYSGNLPDRIFKMLRPPENIFHRDGIPDSTTDRDLFSLWNERLLSRDEEVLIPYAPWEFKGERVLRTVVDKLRIPYIEKEADWAEPEVPDLTSCKRVEFWYQPSMLEFFYTYVRQQDLLSTKDEIDYLRSAQNYTLQIAKEIADLAADLRKAGPTTLISVPSGNYVDLVCHYESKPGTSFRIYTDGDIKSGKALLACEVPSLRRLMPLIHTIDLRMRCAANLKNQWYRFGFYNLHEALRQNDPSVRNKTLYPRPAEWCDDMLRPFPKFGGFVQGKWNKQPHICASAVEGKNHYAMNPNCKPDSPGDTVLLFETKAGWNQHGGPELFTFDNHDPKGGCVLLNDGTVKFIRTKEELQQLRWR